MSVTKMHMNWAADYVAAMKNDTSAQDVGQAFADFFYAFNQRFDRSRFEEACGFEVGDF